MGTELYKTLNRLIDHRPPGDGDADTVGKPYAVRHEQAVESLKVHADAIGKRGELLLEEARAVLQVATPANYSHEMKRLAFNRAAEAYRQRSHTVLHCLVIEVCEINALCMTRRIHTDRLMQVFAPIDDACEVEKQIEDRLCMLEEEVQLFAATVGQSPFLAAAAKSGVVERPRQRASKKAPAKAVAARDQKTSS